MSLTAQGGSSQRPASPAIPNTWTALQTFNAGIACANGTFTGTTPGTAPAGQVLIGGGAINAAGGITCTALTIPQVAGVSQVRAGSINIQCLAATNNSWFSDNAVFDGSSTKYIANGRASGMRFDDGSGKFVVWTAASGLAGAAVTLNNRLEIDGATGAATFAAGITCTTLTVAAADYVYLRGDATTDGSVRMSSQAAGTMLIEKRAGGSWASIGSFA